MNVASLVRTQRDYKATLRAPIVGSRSSLAETAPNELVCGIFKIHLAFAENVKGCNKNGQSNPYVIIKLPEGTIKPPSDNGDSESIEKQKSKVLIGRDCEVVRSHVVYDNLYPSWEESFECILPPVNHREIVMNLNNLLSFDDLLGTV